jgi:hypothetical protein
MYLRETGSGISSSNEHSRGRGALSNQSQPIIPVSFQFPVQSSKESKKEKGFCREQASYDPFPDGLASAFSVSDELSFDCP